MVATPATPKDAKAAFGGGWRPVDLTYANRLQARGLLEKDRIAHRDPTCQECGHRGRDHGLDNLPVPERWRWFNEEPTACQWKACGCQIWRPHVFARDLSDYVVQVRTDDTWIEVPLGRSWVVAYRIVNDRGTPVVGELRVFPVEEDHPRLGEWSADVLGTGAPVPRRGITSRQLRAVRVRAYQRYMADQVARFRAKAPELARAYGWGLAPEPDRRMGPRRGRKGRPDEFYARIADDYARAVERGSRRPIADLARRRKLPTGQVRDMVRQARKRGLLTKEGVGLRGGVLTPRGLALLPKSGRQVRRPV